MEQNTKNKVVRLLRIILIAGSICLIAFSLMSGAENSGALRNIPNSLPWAILLILTCITFRWQILGGILLILFGIFTIIFFSALEFLWILFLISLPIILIGLFFSLLR